MPVDKAWLDKLPPCNMYQYRRKLSEGAEPLFVLDEKSFLLTPAWLLLVKDKNGEIARVVTPNQPFARRVTSIRQLYKVARESGVSTVTIPVEHRR